MLILSDKLDLLYLWQSWQSIETLNFAEKQTQNMHVSNEHLCPPKPKCSFAVIIEVYNQKPFEMVSSKIDRWPS